MTAIEGLLRFGALLVLRPEALTGDVLLAAGVVVATLLVVAVLSAARVPDVAAPAAPRASFAQVRVRLRATDPAASGHVQARAPGARR